MFASSSTLGFGRMEAVVVRVSPLPKSPLGHQSTKKRCPLRGLMMRFLFTATGTERKNNFARAVVNDQFSRNDI